MVWQCSMLSMLSQIYKPQKIWEDVTQESKSWRASTRHRSLSFLRSHIQALTFRSHMLQECTKHKSLLHQNLIFPFRVHHLSLPSQSNHQVPALLAVGAMIPALSCDQRFQCEARCPPRHRIDASWMWVGEIEIMLQSFQVESDSVIQKQHTQWDNVRPTWLLLCLIHWFCSVTNDPKLSQWIPFMPNFVW